MPPENKAEAGNSIGKEELRPVIARGSGVERGHSGSVGPMDVKRMEKERKSRSGCLWSRLNNFPVRICSPPLAFCVCEIDLFARKDA